MCTRKFIPLPPSPHRSFRGCHGPLCPHLLFRMGQLMLYFGECPSIRGNMYIIPFIHLLIMKIILKNAVARIGVRIEILETFSIKITVQIPFSGNSSQIGSSTLSTHRSMAFNAFAKLNLNVKCADISKSNASVCALSACNARRKGAPGESTALGGSSSEWYQCL